MQKHVGKKEDEEGETAEDKDVARRYILEMGISNLSISSWILLQFIS